MTKQLTERRLGQIKDVAREIVLEIEPAERLSFNGVWDAEVERILPRDQDEDSAAAMRFSDIGFGYPLIASIVIPAAIYIGSRIVDKLTDGAIDKVLEKARELLLGQREDSSVRLSDEQVDVIVEKLVERLKKDS